MNEAISNELVAENSVSGVKELIKLIKDNNDLTVQKQNKNYNKNKMNQRKTCIINSYSTR